MEIELSYVFNILKECKKSANGNLNYFNFLVDRELDSPRSFEFVECVIKENKIDIIKEFLDVAKLLEKQEEIYKNLEKKQIKVHLRCNRLEENIKQETLPRKLVGYLRLENFKRRIDSLYDQSEQCWKIQSLYRNKINQLECKLQHIEQEHNQYKAYFLQTKRDIEKEDELLSLLY